MRQATNNSNNRTSTALKTRRGKQPSQPRPQYPNPRPLIMANRPSQKKVSDETNNKWTGSRPSTDRYNETTSRARERAAAQVTPSTATNNQTRKPSPEYIKPDYKAWVSQITQIPNKDELDGMRKIYAYKALAKVYPTVTHWRAGIVLLCPVSDNTTSTPKYETLMVHHPKQIIEDDPVTAGKVIPPRWGFPKGRSQPTDVSAVDTAFREFYEEAGVDVFDPALGARLAYATFTVPRLGEPTRELSVYFFILMDVKPKVTVCMKELDGFQWVTIPEFPSDMSTTKPTALVINELIKVDFSETIEGIELSRTHTTTSQHRDSSPFWSHKQAGTP